MQFIWQPEFASKSEAEKGIFAHVLYDHYDAPSFVF